MTVTNGLIVEVLLLKKKTCKGSSMAALIPQGRCENTICVGKNMEILGHGEITIYYPGH